MGLIVFLAILLATGSSHLIAADIPATHLETKVEPAKSTGPFYWQITPAANSAQLLTLFCRSCESVDHVGDIPLISVLRDSLNDGSEENDRLMDIWLLSYTPHGIGQRMLAAIPFFYWRVGDGSTEVNPRNVKPLMDLTTPEHSTVANATRSVLQWSLFDPMTMPVRAASRSYRTNEVHHERVHLEETIGYLRQAPSTEPNAGLTQSELNTLIARLELRERLLGGFVSRRKAEQVGEKEGFERERVRSANWELLRLSAEKTGLLFEPINVGGTKGEYGLLWYPIDASSGPPSGISVSSLWKVLNMKDPWTDNRLKKWEGPVFRRAVDQNGTLLPHGAAGGREIRLAPLGAYSMDYPSHPLLLIDFRDGVHVRRHEMAQRMVNELTAGIIGLSHFTNWYYYVGADAYDFVMSRHGSAMNLQSRLDCYAQFRVVLALDSSLEADLREDMQRRIDSLSVNPLEGSAEREVQVAIARYNALQQQAGNGELLTRLDDQRRAELAAFRAGPISTTVGVALHTSSLGFYTKRVKPGIDNLTQLDADRRIQANLDFLESVAQSGTRPEVTYDERRVSRSVNEISSLLSRTSSDRTRTRAAAAIARLKNLTNDPGLEADCSSAITALQGEHGFSSHAPALGIAARPLGMHLEPLTIVEKRQ